MCTFWGSGGVPPENRGPGGVPGSGRKWGYRPFWGGSGVGFLGISRICIKYYGFWGVNPQNPEKRAKKGLFWDLCTMTRKTAQSPKWAILGGPGGVPGGPPGGPPRGEIFPRGPRARGPPRGVQGGSPSRALRGVDQPVRGCVIVGAMIND